MAKSERAIHRRPRQTFWHVPNPSALAALIDEAFQQPPYNGNQSTVQKRIGIAQSTLSRLLAGKQERISEKTLRMIFELIGADRQHDLAQCLFDPAARDALSAFTDWLIESEYRLKGRVVIESVPSAIGSLDRRAERRHLLRMMVEHCPAATRAFVEECAARGFKAWPRAGLALCTVIEPLLQSRPTRGIERGWQDLTRDEFIQFVDAGLKRESILLARSRDHIRAQESGAFSSRLVGLDSLSDPRAYHGQLSDPLQELAQCWTFVEKCLTGESVAEPEVFSSDDEPGLR